MKKVIAWLLVLALTTAISIGATLAYLTDTDEDVNVMTLGQVKIDQLEYERVDDETADEKATVQEFHDNKPLLPAVTDKDFNYKTGDSKVLWDQIGKNGYTSEIWDPEKINNEVDKMVFVKNKGDFDAYVRTVFAFEAGKYTTVDEFRSMVHLNLNETDYTWDWSEAPITIGEGTYFVATATYDKVLAPGALTEISLSQIALDKTATNDDVAAFGDTYQILVQSQAIQAAGFDDPANALDEGFGIIPDSTIPWDSDIPTKGIDLIKAVNTYEGKTITSNVKSIVFGKTADYANIAASGEGVLVDVEQDVPVNAYYVQEGALYNIYLLADDTIYLPKDATKMFNGMGKMTTMVVDNLSTERTTSFKGLFQGCNNLETLDVTNWDVSNVNDMIAAFNWCYKLKLIGYENWDVSNVTNMAMMFQSNRAATEFDLSKWDMSSVTTIASMFQDCQNLTEVDATGWDLSDVTTFNQTFLECFKLTDIKGIADWDTSNVTNFAMVFYRCRALEYVDVTKWDTGKGEVFNSMFATTDKLVLNKTDLQGWDMRNAVKINHMFYGALSIPELDLSGWDMPKLITTTHMFADCTSLKTVDFTDWNTPSLISLDCMFNDCDDLVYVDMSDIDTANVTEFSQLFERCTRLEKIDGLDQWDTSKAGTFSEMFLGCSALKELDLSAFDTRAAYDNYYDTNNSYSTAFVPFTSNMNSLVKLIVSDKISYYGNGNVSEANKLVLPAPAPKDGFIAKWRNVETGELYLAKDIPELTAATYEAYYEPVATN